MGKSTISMAIFNSNLLNYQRVVQKESHWKVEWPNDPLVSLVNKHGNGKSHLNAQNYIWRIAHFHDFDHGTTMAPKKSAPDPLVLGAGFSSKTSSAVAIAHSQKGPSFPIRRFWTLHLWATSKAEPSCWFESGDETKKFYPGTRKQK